MNTQTQKIMVEMTSSDYKRYLEFLEADKIVRSIKKGLRQAREARAGKRKLKSAYDLAKEL